MKILYKYFIKKFLLTYLIIIGLFIFIAMVFDFSEKVDDFVRNSAPLKEIIFGYYLNFIPYFMNLFSSLFIFTAAIYFTSRLAANTEIVAILTSGTNYYRLFIPYFVVAFFLALLTFILLGWVIPEGAKKMFVFENKYVHTTYNNTENHIHLQISPGVYMYLQNYDAMDSLGFKFSLEEFNGLKLKYKMQAQMVKWNHQKREWDVTDYTIRTLDSFSETYTRGKKKSLKLPVTPDDFGRKDENVQTMNNGQLRQYIKTEQLRGEGMVPLYKIELYKRFSMPFSTFVLVLIAFPIASRKVRGGTGMHLGYGIMITFTYILFMQFATVFSVKANFDPFISVWIPNVLFAILGLFLLLKTPK